MGCRNVTPKPAAHRPTGNAPTRPPPTFPPVPRLDAANPITSLERAPRMASSSCSTVFIPVGNAPVTSSTSFPGIRLTDSRASVSSKPESCWFPNVVSAPLLRRSTRAYPDDSATLPSLPRLYVRPTGTVISLTRSKTRSVSKV